MSAGSLGTQPFPPGGYTGRPWRRAARELLQAGLERSPLAGRLLWRLPAPAEAVALTFDDGPDPEHTPCILDLLAASGARATFFLIGERAARCPELVRRIVSEGHAVGNHTYSHVSCSGLPPQRLREELRATDAVLEALGTVGPRLFRPPYGALRPELAWRLIREGRRVVLWSRDSRDYRGASTEAVAALGESVEPRDVLLLHDRFPATVAALPRLLEHLARRGLGTVTLADQDVNPPTQI